MQTKRIDAPPRPPRAPFDDSVSLEDFADTFSLRLVVERGCNFKAFLETDEQHDLGAGYRLLEIGKYNARLISGEGESEEVAIKKLKEDMGGCKNCVAGMTYHTPARIK